MGLIRERLGIFRGFGESRFEVVSDVLIPYRERRHMPLQGGYLIVGVEDFDGRPSGVLGRVVRAYPLGDLLSGAGEDYLVDLMRLDQEIPEAVRVSRLRYRVSLRLVGQVSESDDGAVMFSPSLRMTPHVGAPVGLPSDDVLRLIASGARRAGDNPGAQIGHLAIGDLVFDGSPRVHGRNFPVHFRMDSLVGRRSAVFARAGMGKSNFVKVLLTRLYQDPSQRVGTIVIDPEGEYAMSNASEPGLLDVPSLAGRVILFTDRTEVDPRYREDIAGPCRLDFAELAARDIVASAVAIEKQETVFANSLRGLDRGEWSRLLELLVKNKYRTNPLDVANIIGRRSRGSDSEDVICAAIINNLVPVVQRLHASGSCLRRRTFEHLRQGGIVILDVSMLSGTDAQRLSAWILNEIFSNNQMHYTSAREAGPGGHDQPRLVPTLAVLEEAQYYLGGRDQRDDSAFVRWFKEGRKYQLGSIIVTQQPGAVGSELISQCDNFFTFHLLSGQDLESLGRANLHYSHDILNSLASEPIPGNCFFWSSRGLSMVTCARILAFSNIVEEARKESGLKTEAAPEQSTAARVAEAAPEPARPAPPQESEDPIVVLAKIVERSVQYLPNLALYPVRSRKLAWVGAKDGDYPPAEQLLVTNAYNLRFQVTDALEERFPPGDDTTGARELLLESFAERRIVREHLLQRALRQQNLCPERLIAKAKHPKQNKEGEYIVLFRERIQNTARVKSGPGMDIEVLP
ncbi:MAG: DUF87 domain-containing protein [Anaerolineales bacterium]|nr:DUF87 domain-containing protein [Anaerolineales bacterium]